MFKFLRGMLAKMKVECSFFLWLIQWLIFFEAALFEGIKEETTKKDLLKM